MNSLRRAYYSFDNWGVLRYVSRFVRQELGLHEVAFHDRVRTDASADRTRWPIITTVLEVLEGYMAPPGSWGLFVEEIHRYLTTELGLADDTALRTALDVQLAHLPAPARSFPLSISLAHDFVAWQNALLSARENGHRDDWELVVPRLATYPAAEMTISDPERHLQHRRRQADGGARNVAAQLGAGVARGASSPGADLRRGLTRNVARRCLRPGRRRGS